MSDVPAYSKFTLSEWNKVVDLTTGQWRKRELKKQPTYRKVKRDVPGGLQMDVVSVIAFALLALIITFTASKAALAVIPAATSMWEHLVGVGGNDYAIVPLSTFVHVSQAMVALMSELGMIYFMLLSAKVHTPQWITPNPNLHNPYLKSFLVGLHWLGHQFDIRVITARLPRLAVWGTVAYVTEISSSGSGSVIVKFLPLVMGMGLAVFVEEKVAEMISYRAAVHEHLRGETAAWRAREKNMWHDAEFLKMLYNIMKEQLIIVRRRKMGGGWFDYYQPNAHLEKANEETLDTILLTEYNRLRPKATFAEAVKAGVQEDEEAEAEQAVASSGETALVKRVNIGNGRVVAQRFPVNGTRWTPETLKADLLALKYDIRTVDRGIIRKIYANKYGAQPAFDALRAAM